jgi:hypothetical protein
VNRLFSHGQAQIDHVYPWVYIIEPIRAIAVPLPRSNRFLMGGVEEASTFSTINIAVLAAFYMVGSFY